MSDVSFDPPPLERVMNAMRLVESCISNIAFYKAGWTTIDGERTLINQRNFWIRTNGNFLDMAALEWCKLFIDKDVTRTKHGEHNWKNIFLNEKQWLLDMLSAISVLEEDFHADGKLIKSYRDQYLAHLDKKGKQLYYPKTEIMLKTTSYLHEKLKVDAGYSIGGYYNTIDEFYLSEFLHASDEIKKSATNQ